MRPFRIKVVNLPYKCDVSKPQIDSFQCRYFVKQRPVKYEAKVCKQLNALPALDKWIVPYKSSENKPFVGPYKLTQYLEHFGNITVPIERTTWENSHIDKGSSNSWGVKGFERFEAPLEFFLKWTKKKLENPDTFCPNESLYIAQCSMLDLDEQMRKDLPTPMYAAFTSDEEHNKWKKTAKKEKEEMPWIDRNVISSSIWMGLPPTETPLHKDPNHNFLAQIAGFKRIRLMTPDSGRLLLAYAKREVALAQRRVGSLPGRLEMSMRGEEMMVGPERKLMSELIWGTEVIGPKDRFISRFETEPSGFLVEEQNLSTVEEQDDTSSQLEHEVDLKVKEEAMDVMEQAEEPEKSEHIDHATPNHAMPGSRDTQFSEEDEIPSVTIFETTLAPGAALFIPQGWYHSVRSLGNHKNGINVSANWWFNFAGRLQSRDANK